MAYTNFVPPPQFDPLDVDYDAAAGTVEFRGHIVAFECEPGVVQMCISHECLNELRVAGQDFYDCLDYKWMIMGEVRRFGLRYIK